MMQKILQKYALVLVLGLDGVLLGEDMLFEGIYFIVSANILFFSFFTFLN